MNNSEKISAEEEKPPKFYHGSARRSLGELDPLTKEFRDGEDGRFLFAAPDKAISACYMIEGVQWITGVFKDTPYVLLRCTQEEFLQKDKGGVIYTLPNDTFKESQTSGREIEWASKEKVQPESIEDFGSTLEAMIEYGVQVYFVSEEIFKQIEECNDDDLLILRKLKAENIKSENQERGINVRPLLESENLE